MFENAKQILFNTDMVRAILDGRKTETRRPIKPQPKEQLKCVIPHETRGMSCWMEENADQRDRSFRFHKSYEVGDILYVRETWQQFMEYEIPAGRPRGPHGTLGIPATPDQKSYYCYKADGELENPEYGKVNWLPSIHMPKEAARIFLRVTDVKAERLQDITEEGAIFEGIRGWTKDGTLYKYGHIEPGDPGATQWQDMSRTAVQAYSRLWDELYKTSGYGWEVNPWVWVIKYERIGV